MKKLLMIILWVTALSALAQGDYRPFVEDGKRWNYKSRIMGSDNYFYYYCLLSGDIIINGQNCIKLHVSYEGWGGPYVHAALYEIDKKVYYYEMNSVASILLYDFSLEKGQTVYNRKRTYLVTDIDTVFNSGQQFKRFHLQDSISGICFKWIEGVGINNSFTNSFQNLFGGMEESVISCEVNGETLFTEEGFYSLGISSSIHANEATAAPTEKSVFDLQGRRRDAVPSKCVYIKDGRKVLR